MPNSTTLADGLTISHSEPASAAEPQKAINIFNLDSALELLPKAERLHARGILTEAEYTQIKDALLYVND